MSVLGTLLAITSSPLVTTTGLSSRRQKACIVLSVANGAEKVIMPVVPGNIPEVSVPQNNETFNGIIGDMSVIGVMGLRTLKLEGLLPGDVSRYSWTYPNSNNGADIINFINRYRNKYVPFRITITRGSAVYLNMAFIINNFSYYCDNVGDYHYTMDCVEYRIRDAKTGGLVS